MIPRARRRQATLLPPSVEDYVPQDHPARFVVAAVEQIDLSAIHASYSKTHGCKSYDPAMLLSLWICGYIEGIRSSRTLEAAEQHQLKFMYVAAGQTPDHDTLARFRKQHREHLHDVFRQVLHVASGLGYLRLGTLAVDGTKLKANAEREKTLTLCGVRKQKAYFDKLISRLLKASDKIDAAAAKRAAKQPSMDLARLGATVSKLATIEAQLQAAQAAKDAAAVAKQASKDAADAAGKRPQGRPPHRDGGEASDDEHDRSGRASDEGARGYLAELQRANWGGCGHPLDCHPACNTRSQRLPSGRPALTQLQQLPDHVGEATAILADAGYYRKANVAHVKMRVSHRILRRPAKVLHRCRKVKSRHR